MRTCCALLSFLSLAVGLSVSQPSNKTSSPLDTTAWSQVAALGSGKAFGQDDFGLSVAISEDQNTIVVGAPGWGSGGAENAAYVFIKPAGGWTSTTIYTAKLTNGPQNNTDYFGDAVAISGDVIVVGAPSVPHQDSSYGSVYVFVKPASGWKDTSHYAAELTSPHDQGIQSGFGSPVAIEGKTVVVGGAADSAGKGLAFIYVEPASGWRDVPPVAQLRASDGFGSDGFGFSVAIDHQTLVVGAIQWTPNTGGEAYVFVEPVSGWTDGTETARLLPSDGKPGDLFGTSIAIMGGTVVVGAYELNDGPGAAYIFVRPPDSWKDATETAELTASDGQMNDEFGDRVGTLGDTIFVGAPGHSAVYEFLRPEGGWKSTSDFNEELRPTGRVEFGESLALRSQTLVVGGITGYQAFAPSAAFVFGQ